MVQNKLKINKLWKFWKRKTWIQVETFKKVTYLNKKKAVSVQLRLDSDRMITKPEGAGRCQNKLTFKSMIISFCIHWNLESYHHDKLWRPWHEKSSQALCGSLKREATQVGLWHDGDKARGCRKMSKQTHF